MHFSLQISLVAALLLSLSSFSSCGQGLFFHDPTGNGGSATSYSQTILADSRLVGYWRMNESSGSTGFDISTHSNDGTYSGAITFGVSGAIANTSDTAANIPSGGSLDISGLAAYNFGSGDFSVEFWFRSTGCGGAENVLNVSTSPPGMTFDCSSNGQMTFTDDLSTSLSSGFGTASLGDGNWHHIVGVKSGSNVLYYFDGSLANSNVSAVSTFNFSAENIAFQSFSGGGADFDEIALYNGALTATEVLGHYNLGTGN